MGKESCKTCENTLKSPKFMLSFTFSKDVQWAGLESLLVPSRPLGLMFTTPVCFKCLAETNFKSCDLLNLLSHVRNAHKKAKIKEN